MYLSQSRRHEPGAPSFVVQVYGGDSQSSLEPCGTAFFVNEQQLLTCRHVICTNNRIIDGKIIYGQEYELIAIEFNGRKLYCEKKYTIPHKEHDIVIISISEPVDITVPLISALGPRTARCLKSSDAWGFPLVLQGTLSSFKITNHLKHQKWPQQTGVPWRIQFQGGIAHGHSGGPILFYDAGSWHCLGMTDLGWVGSPTSNSFSSNEIQEFLSISKVAFEKGTLPDLAIRTFKHIAVMGLFVALVSIGIWQKFSMSKIHPATLSRASINTKPQQNAIPLGKCDAKSMDDFRADNQYRILVLRYANVGDANSSKASVGYSIGRNNEQQIKRLITEHAKKPSWKLANLNDTLKQVLFQSCFVETHEQANDIGLQKKADLVVWGRVLDSDLENPPSLGSTHPNVTVVRFPSVTTAISQKVDYGAAQEFLRLQFDQLVPSDAINLIFGLYAYHNDRYGITLDYLSDFERRDWPATEDASGLLSVITRSYVFTGNGSAAIKTAQRATELCPNEHCTAHRAADLAMAAYYANNKPLSGEASRRAINLGKKINDKAVLQLAMFFDAMNSDKELSQTIRNMTNDQAVASCSDVKQAERDIANDGDFGEIEKKLKAAIAVALDRSDILTEATGQVSLGKLYVKHKKLNDAEDAFERANTLLSWVGMYPSRLKVLLDLSILYSNEKKLEELRKTLHAAEDLMEQHHATKEKLYCDVISRLAMIQNHLDGSSYEEKALSCIQMIKSDDWKPALLLHKAGTLIIANKIPQAKQLISQVAHLCSGKAPPKSCEIQSSMLKELSELYKHSR